MADDFSILTEAWRETLEQLVSAVSSKDLTGDAQRIRVRRELMDALHQCRSLIESQNDLQASMQSLRDLMEEDGPANRIVRASKERVLRR